MQFLCPFSMFDPFLFAGKTVDTFLQATRREVERTAAAFRIREFEFGRRAESRRGRDALALEPRRKPPTIARVSSTGTIPGCPRRPVPRPPASAPGSHVARCPSSPLPPAPIPRHLPCSSPPSSDEQHQPQHPPFCRLGPQAAPRTSLAQELLLAQSLASPLPTRADDQPRSGHYRRGSRHQRADQLAVMAGGRRACCCELRGGWS